MLKSLIFFLPLIGALGFTAYAQDATTSLQADTQNNNDRRCEAWTERLNNYWGELNEAKIRKIETYDAATDRLTEMGTTYAAYEDEAVKATAEKLLNDTETFSSLVHDGNEKMTMGLSEHYYNLVSLVETAQNSAIECSTEGLKVDLDSLRTGWSTFSEDREYVKYYWTSNIKEDLNELKDAIRDFRGSKIRTNGTGTLDKDSLDVSTESESESE